MKDDLRTLITDVYALIAEQQRFLAQDKPEHLQFWKTHFPYREAQLLIGRHRDIVGSLTAVDDVVRQTGSRELGVAASELRATLNVFEDLLAQLVTDLHGLAAHWK